MSELEYRRPSEDKILDYMSAISRGFGYASVPPEETDDFLKFLGHVDALGAFDGSTVAGTMGVLDFETNVPDGLLRTGGMTIVTVQPTHRRRGILTEMMGRMLERRRERGDVMVSLLASEAPIYGRFGYGLGVPRVRYKIDKQHAVLRTTSSDNGSLRLADPKSVKSSLSEIFEAAGANRPGWINRTDFGWDHQLQDPEYNRHGRSELHCALYEDDGGPEGYVLYRRDGDGREKVEVGELIAATPVANEALWRYIFGIDLVEKIEAGTRPVDDALPWMLSDMRSLEMLRQDWIWSRILDVPAVLEARSYGADGTLVIRVIDESGGWCDGTYRLEIGDGEAKCAATGDSPDLTMSVADLSSIYFGGVRPSVLARAGQIEVRSEATLNSADGIFATQLAPWDIVDF